MSRKTPAEPPMSRKTPAEPLNTPSSSSNEPLSSRRLRPIRFQTRRAVAHIREDESVRLDFLRPGRASEVMEVSPDGRQVTLDGAAFVFPALPPPVMKKYAFARKFVAVVRSRTPKVTLFTRRARCVLMESADFELTFYGGAKVALSPDGTSTSAGEALEFARECRERCREVERLLEELSCAPFPVTVGRRPQERVEEPSRPASCEQRVLRPEETSRPASCEQRVLRPEEPSRPAFLCEQLDLRGLRVLRPELRSVFVSDVGWACPVSERELAVNFNDGAQLTLEYSAEQTVRRIRLLPCDGARAETFSPKQQLPKHVCARLEKMPRVLQRLRDCSTNTSAVSATSDYGSLRVLRSNSVSACR